MKHNLKEWLEYIQSIHLKEMDLGLERVALAVTKLDLNTPVVITVAGTNGKGSCVAGLESIYIEAGYRVGAFTSPFLWRHTEQVRLQGVEACEEDFCRAFEEVEQARGEVTLTLFEFNTLAAFIIFKKANLDVWILEVGLGGRLDAVNVLDADIAVVASIGIDHTDWLGYTREKIALEKAGIFRSYHPAVCGDFNPPQTLLDYAEKIKTPLFCQNKQFGFEKKDKGWDWWSDKKRFINLPQPRLALQNMATVLMAVELLEEKLPVSREDIAHALGKVSLPGRIQVLPGDVTQVLDVSHNPAAAEFLATWLRDNKIAGKTHAVFSMLADKDMVGTLNVIQAYIDDWYVAPLQTQRAAPLEKIADSLKKAQITRVKNFSSIAEAHQQALQHSKTGDRIVVFGSFHTVAEARM